MVKILAFTDLHASSSAFEKLKEKAKEVDLIVCAGDFTIFEQNLKEQLAKLNTLGKEVLMIPGNHEDEIILKKSCEAYEHITYIHEEIVYRLGITFVGYGGGGFQEHELTFPGIIKEEQLVQPVVLVTHAPPHNTPFDELTRGSHVGVIEYKEFIEKYKPLISIFGHLHEHAGKQEIIDKTVMINPGPTGRILTIESKAL